jgi:hypothetical protein
MIASENFGLMTLDFSYRACEYEIIKKQLLKILTILVQRFLLIIVILDLLFKKLNKIERHFICLQMLIAGLFGKAREKYLLNVLNIRILRLNTMFYGSDIFSCAWK